jgi:hypothetical protein
MLKWSFKREAQWMVWLYVVLPLLGLGSLLYARIVRLR